MEKTVFDLNLEDICNLGNFKSGKDWFLTKEIVWVLCMHTCMLRHFIRVWVCDLMDCSQWGSFVPGILQARILEWVAMPSSKGPSQPKDQTQVSYSSCIVGRFFTIKPPGIPLKNLAQGHIMWKLFCLSVAIPWIVSVRVTFHVDFACSAGSSWRCWDLKE